MIELPEFPDENWYLSNIQHLFLNGHIKKDIYKKFISSPSVQDINNELTAIIPDSLFSDKSPNKLLFEKLILAPFEELEQVKAKVDSLNKDLFLTTTTKNNRESSIPIGVWKILYDSYDVFVRRKNNTKLIDKYGISCCPYCNENFIFNRNTVAMAQLDHFYPRDKYPIFSLCLYNLVPACASCNHVKSNTMLPVSPHNHSFDFSKMHFSYTPLSADWIIDTKSLSIDIRYDKEADENTKKLDNNIKILEIKEAYDHHKDYLQEILKKASIYNDDTINQIMNNFPGLFSSVNEIKRVLYGNYIDEKDFLKRPLSKFTKDILDELKK